MNQSNNIELNWILPEPLKKSEIANTNFPFALKAVLARRGIKQNEDILNFIYPPELPDPINHFPELNKAVDRIIDAKKNNQKIAICGDYDADGMTSTALLSDALNQLNIDVVHSIPSRINEGYGLNTNIIDNLYENSVELIITVDNGVSAFKAINQCNNYGIDLIISDHHTIPNNIPYVYSLIHPLTTPENSPYRYLAGVGIAFIIIKSLADKLSNYSLSKKSLDYCCVGTIADMSPLIGANRKLIKQGLSQLYKTRSIGLQELIRISGIDYNEITSEDIGFKIAPRINAIGRIDDPNIIIDLLTDDNRVTANEKAIYCDTINKKRKHLCKKAFEESLEILDLDNISPFILIAQSHWHLGIIGLLASQLMNRFHKPVAVLTSDGNGSFRASARSPSGFNLIKALEKCSDLLVAYGGHKVAAGFTVKAEVISELQLKLNNIVGCINSLDLLPRINPDYHLSFNEINDELLTNQYKLEPFGVDNTKPLFWSRNCRIDSLYKLKGGHYKLNIERDSKILQAVHWNSEFVYYKNQYVDIAYNLEINRWNNTKSIQLNIISAKIHSEVMDLNIYNKKYKTYKCPSRGIVISNSDGIEISNSDYQDNDKWKDNENAIRYIEGLFSSASIALAENDLYI